MTFGDACLYSVTGLMVVFFALILLMSIIKIMTAVGDSVEKKAALAAAAAAPAPAAEPAKGHRPERRRNDHGDRRRDHTDSAQRAAISLY